MFAEVLQLITAKPLIPRRLGKLILERGGSLCWAEFGEVDELKVKHTILYFHGAPGCRFEPVMHSSLSHRKIAHEEISKHKMSSAQCKKDRNPSMTPIHEESEELDIYAQRGIRLICIERPGFGDSTFLENRTVADYVADVIEVINSDEMNLINNRKNFRSDQFHIDGAHGSGLKSGSKTTSDLDQRHVMNCAVNEGNQIYVIGYSAGGPYALAMRALFDKKLLQFQKENQANSETHQIKIAGVCVVASSVGAAENIPYKESTEGKILNSFFSFPASLQSILYSGGVYVFLCGVRASIFCLSNFITIRHDSPFRVNEVENKFINRDRNENESPRRDDAINKSTAHLEDILLKLHAIQFAVSKSIEHHGGRAMTTDTLATQWEGRPWGFDLITAPGQELPPVLFYYSKEDQTVPPETGVFLCEKVLGGGAEPVWLSGGHSCFILHLDRILDELIKIK